MTILEANKEIAHLDNEINKLLNDKELLLKYVEPGAVDTSKVITTGGKREDRFLNYTMKEEEKEINKKLDIAYGKRNNLENWIENELIIIGKYHELEQQIIYYKEVYIPKNKFETTWWFIANKVNASESTCKRIYRKYKKSRDI